jgi:hypothetical protein
MKWNELDYKLSSIHGNEKRKDNDVKVKLVDRNGMLLNYVTKVEYKEEYSEPDKYGHCKITGQYLEVVIN